MTSRESGAKTSRLSESTVATRRFESERDRRVNRGRTLLVRIHPEQEALANPLEDPRLSRYYLDALKRRVTSPLGDFWQRSVVRPGLVPALVVTLLIGGLAIAYRERGRGHLHKLEARIVTEHQDAPVARPGGQEPISLARTRLAGTSAPEFLGVTLLPGRGMNVLQIKAFIPTRGEVDLLQSPTIDIAQTQMTGAGADAAGAASLAMGGAFEVPWAGPIWGSFGAGHITTSWRGHTVTVPQVGTAVTGISGLLLARSSDSIESAAMPDGGQTTATYSADDFGAHWPSKTQVKVTVLLSGRSVDLNVTAQNVGDFPEPIGIGWRPRFLLLGDRAGMRLRMPAQMRIVRERGTGQPTGALAAVSGTPYNFTAREGTRLGSLDLDETFVQLHQEFLDNGPVIELKDPANDYGLRMTLLSNSIKAVHVFSKHDANYFSIDPQSNYDDPFGKEWSKDPDAGIVVLSPGQTTRWRVRLELFPLSGGPAPF
jgi:aldose 1-epimerase